MLPIVSDSQHLRGVPATIAVTWLDSTGEPAAAPGTVTVHVSRGDGTDVLAAGSPTVVSGNEATVDLNQTKTVALDVLTAVWTDGTTTFTTVHEIVGGFYFTIAEARAGAPVLADEAKYSAADIIRVRREVEEEFERICNVAFVPRYRRSKISGDQQYQLRLPDTFPRKIRHLAGLVTTVPSGTLDRLVLSVTGWVVDPFGAVLWEPGNRNLVVEYEHGWDRPPLEVKTAAIMRLRQRLNMPASGIPQNAMSYTAENGATYRLARPTETTTGNDDIDAVLARYSMRTEINKGDAPIGRPDNHDWRQNGGYGALGYAWAGTLPVL